MAFWRLALFAAAVLACSSSLRAAQDEPVVVDDAQDEYGPQKFTCPVGGEQFEQNTNWVGYPLAARPDGGTLGTEFSDIMVPECPGNGLVMVPKHDGSAGDLEAFTPYAETEIAKLPALVASPEYQALRKEARFFRLYWIAKKLDRPAIQQLHLLQHISFITVPPEQQRRYLEFFVTETDAVLAGEQLDPMTQLSFNLYVGNALRQLGRFDEARKRMEQVIRTAQELRSERLAATPTNPHFEEDGDFEEDDGALSVAEEQLKAIAEGDTDKHPVSMMSDRVANSVCNGADDDYPPATETTIRACAQRKIDVREQEEKSQAQFDKERELLANPQDLARLCAATPQGKREEVVEQACQTAERLAQNELKGKEAARLLKNPKALDERCKSVVIPVRYAQSKTGLGEACQKRAEIVRDEQGKAIAAKMRKEPAEFDRLCKEDAYDMHSEDPVELACYEVDTERDDAMDEAQRARMAKMTEAEISAECERTNGGKDVPGYAFGFRCSEIESEREEAAWKTLGAEPEKLATTCAAPYEQQPEAFRWRCNSYNDDKRRDAAMELARDHPKLVEACKATPVPQRDAILAEACNSFRKCVIVRLDELPFDQVGPLYWDSRPDPAETSATCYDSVEEASAAFASYRNDPKSLRATGCKPETELPKEYAQGHDAECARYAKGEDVLVSAARGPSGPVSYDECKRANEAGTQMDCDAIKQEEEELERVNSERETCIKKEMKKRGLKYTGSDKAIGYLQVWEDCEALRGTRDRAAAVEVVKR